MQSSHGKTSHLGQASSLSRELATQDGFDGLHFGFHSAICTCPIVDLDLRAYTWAIALKSFETVSDNCHDLSPIALDDRTHWCQLVGQATPVDDIKYASYIGALAFLFGGRSHRKFEQHHWFMPFLVRSSKYAFNNEEFIDFP